MRAKTKADRQLIRLTYIGHTVKIYCETISSIILGQAFPLSIRLSKMSEKVAFEIILEPFGLRFTASSGVNLARFLREKGIPLRSDCGGKGKCGKCLVNISSPDRDDMPPQPNLACRTDITADYLVNLPVSSLVNPSEAVDKALDFNLFPPDFQAMLRPGFGLAIDLGTTTIAGFLCDYGTGKIAGTAVVPNPQAVYGADVMSRIAAAASSDEHLQLLKLLSVSAVDELALSLTRGAGLTPDVIDEILVVGNSTMLHLFLGVDPGSMGERPFRPVFKDSQERSALEIGLKLNARARVMTLPLVSGFVGADLVSAALAQRMPERPDGTMLIDIGTNGEIILKAGGKFYATSCATGPAFEGATIENGMLALSGAIDSFSLNGTDGSTRYTLIQQRADSPVKARGICGSGLISIAAALLRSGIVDSSGRMRPDTEHPNLRTGRNGIVEFVVAGSVETESGEDVVLTQKDIRALQLAKGAIHTGIVMLCRSAESDWPKDIILAGSFGSHIDIHDLPTLGILPPGSSERTHIVGNAAGVGAVMAAMDPHFRTTAKDFAEKIQVVELAAHPDFQNIFLDSLSFPGSGDSGRGEEHETSL
jgi:uncharacterized 2Fe-2S/4Fe-4S cluster protein (DUF4445 family)